MNIEYQIDKYINLMRKLELQLPKRWSGGDFYYALESHFKTYLSYLEPDISKAKLNRINTITNKILKTVKSYHSGYPAEAYKSFSNVMTFLMKEPFKIYEKNWYQEEAFRKKDSFKLYRIRNIQMHATLSRKDIFHVPYSYRSKVDTSRYSIAGFPCLYLATNLELCCEESKLSSFNDLRIASRYQLERNESVSNLVINIIEMGIKPIHFYDYFVYSASEINRDYTGIDKEMLSKVRDKDRYMKRYFSEIDLLDEEVRSNYLYWYPLISSCSFIRTSKNDKFASEYIIPQLLMQWIRSQSNESNLFGIRYFSCASLLASDKGFNYVFPTSGDRLNDKYDYCNILSKSFRFSEPYYVHEFDNLERCEKFLDDRTDFGYLWT